MTIMITIPSSRHPQHPQQPQQPQQPQHPEHHEHHQHHHHHHHHHHHSSPSRIHHHDHSSSLSLLRLFSSIMQPLLLATGLGTQDRNSSHMHWPLGERRIGHHQASSTKANDEELCKSIKKEPRESVCLRGSHGHLDTWRVSSRFSFLCLSCRTS